MIINSWNDGCFVEITHMQFQVHVIIANKQLLQQALSRMVIKPDMYS